MNIKDTVMQRGEGNPVIIPSGFLKDMLLLYPLVQSADFIRNGEKCFR